MATRLCIVSNRLPVTVCHEGTAPVLVDSAGGLATGLRACHERGDGLWFGWPGDVTRPAAADHAAEAEAALASRRLVPVHLSAREVRQYYQGFANGVIWPLFHYLTERVPLDGQDWQAYRDVNEKFADTVSRHHRPGDVIWVHDYQLMLLPALLRTRLPGARIGFFLHIPFPSSELFRILPWRTSLLEGLLGADLIGFHTHAYLRHFVVALRQIMDLEPTCDVVAYHDREIALGSYPMGVDAAAFEALANEASVSAGVAAIRDQADGRRILLGIDRLDYTKGIPRRLLAFERLLETEPALRERVRLIQIAVPSREDAEPYQAFRRQVEEIVGRVNGRFGSLGATPIHYLHRAVCRADLVALYRACDVMLVTPVRDGMNLVAKEFVASRTDEDGVLILSEFAGAAAELGEALLVNPYDRDAMALAMRDALAMDRQQRRTRMRDLRARVKEQDVHRWTRSFLAALDSRQSSGMRPRISSASDLAALAERLRGAAHLAILLDYDGTLVPLTGIPGLAHPDADLIELLRALASGPNRAVHLVSGRDHDTLEQWFGHVPVHLWAEHGVWHRPPHGRQWETSVSRQDWMSQARPILDWFTARTPGSLVETKATALAWHYRMTDPELGADHARHLRRTLAAALNGQPIDILRGKKVVELRPRGTTKGNVVHRILHAHRASRSVLLAVGDDQTDEDMFAALPASAVSIRVGPGRTQALHRVRNPEAVRSLVRDLIV